MKFITSFLLATSALTNALSPTQRPQSLANRDALAPSRDHLYDAAYLAPRGLERRKGGGGGGRGSGTGSGSGSGSSGNAGGRSPGGSGVAPSRGGYYGGGSATPYGAGAVSPRGITPLLLPLAALSILPGLWLYGAYEYRGNQPVTYFNQTSNTNMTLPVDCLCGEYAECGCDDNGDSAYVQSLVGNGDYTQGLQNGVVVGVVNSQKMLIVNGTLDNGTTADDGTSNVSSTSGTVLHGAGWWVLGAAVGFTVWLAGL